MMGSTLVRRQLCVFVSQTWYITNLENHMEREKFELRSAVLKLISFAPTPWNEIDINKLAVTSNVEWPCFIKGNVIHIVSSHLHSIPFIAIYNG